MTLTIVALNPREEFLEFIDPELCDIKEEIEYAGLRTLNLTYKFQDYTRAKELFTLGNKIWVQGDENLTDCLYVINTEVEQDIYEENSFTLELEEVLVELNYAPLFSQTELSRSEFRKITTNGQQQIIVNWNALNYLFKNYFNIGVVQDAISVYAQRATITGTQTLMSILRTIEEQTGNVFVTRYEKDVLDNTIHRYLDFLNPINITKNWSIHLEYDFQSNTSLDPVTDQDDNPTVEDHPWEVTPYTSNLDPESVTESEEPPEETQTAAPSTYNKDDDRLYDYDTSPDYTPLINLNPADCCFRLTDNESNVLVADNDEPLQWECSDAGMDTSHTSCVITLQKKDDILGVTVNESSFAVIGANDVVEPPAYLSDLNSNDYLTILTDNERSINTIPDGSYFEIYDNTHSKVLFRTQLNIEIGTVHEEVLDFGFNLENITYDVDETDTYTAVSPVLGSSTENGLSRTQLNSLIESWSNLTVQKGTVIPMIVEKVNVKASTLNNAKSVLTNHGSNPYSVSSNYFVRPFNPQDNKDGSTPSDYTWEFYRATAYWKAPYNKNSKELHVSTDTLNNTQYQEIYTRTDIRDERNTVASPKMGITESSDENVYAIYNQVANYLREHETPNIDINVDVANLIGHRYNQYNLHDKIYIKMPDSQELLTARVTKTSKEAHDVAKNTIEISNYKTLNTLKTITENVYIESNGAKFKYPRTGTLTARLINTDYDSTDYYSVEHPANKLLSFTIYENTNGSPTFTGKVYTKKTDSNGYAKINIDLNPGDYDVEINFSGDEVYSETSLTVKVNVSGKLDVVPQMAKKETNSKTTSTTTTTTKKTIKTYYNKCGVSPDKKRIVSVAKPSASVSDAKYRGVSMNQWYKTVFKNKCPECGRTGTLRFDGGKANKCITSSTYGHPWKNGVPEHEITCIKCDSDYDGVTGLEKNYGHSTRLTTVEKPKKATKADVGTLVKGKMVYKTTTKTITSKSTTDSKSRYIRAAGINSAVKKQATAIVGNSTGLTAFKKIASWMDRHIAYAGYSNFQRSPATCLKKGSANCCDGTRLLFQLADAAGLSEYFNMYYIHVSGHVYGQVVTKKTGKKRYVDCASDYAACWGYICRNYRGRSVLQKTLYPKLPF